MKRSINIKAIKLSILIVIFTVGLTSCFSLKPSTTKSGEKLYESFFVSSKENQYFIKPLKFVNNQEKYPLLLDITFRDKSYKTDSAIINFTFESKQIIKVVDSLILNSKSGTVAIKEIGHIYTEKEKKSYQSRFTSKCKTLPVVLLFEDNQWNIEIYAKGKKYMFIPSKKTLKSIKTLDENIFAIIRE